MKKSKTHKPSPNQAFSLGGKESPRSNQPVVAKKATLTEAANARIRQHENYFALLEAEQEAAQGGWHSENEEFFAKFRKGE